MDASRMVVRSLGALGSIRRIEERMRETGSDGLEIVDADGETHAFDGTNLPKARLERTPEGWLWICLREGRETIFQESADGIAAIGYIEQEVRPGPRRKIILMIEDCAKEDSMDAIADILRDLANGGADTLTLLGSGVENLLEESESYENMHFRRLEIHGSELDLDLFLLSGFHRHLQSLHLLDCRIPPGGFAALRDIKRLEALSLDNVELPSDEFAHLVHLPKLDTLGLSGMDIDSLAMSHVGRCLGITDLRLHATSFVSTGLLALAQLPLLRELVLDTPDIEDSEVPFLLQLSNLDYLDVKDTAITEIGLECLHRHLPYLGTLVPKTRFEDCEYMGENGRYLPTDLCLGAIRNIVAISERSPA